MGGEWHKGRKDDKDLVGPKDRMKAAAARLGHKALLQAERRGGKGFYNVFGSYPDWEAAAAALERVPPSDRHAYELLPAGAPLKPYMDVDCDEIPAGFADVGAVAARIRGLTAAVLKKDFGVEVAEADVAITHSPNQKKACSLHLVVSTHAPQLLFRRAEDARALAVRVAARFPDCGVDLGVYTRDRAMRLCGATKSGKPDSALGVLGGGEEEAERGAIPRDAVVTWLDAEETWRFIDPPEGDASAPRAKAGVSAKPKDNGGGDSGVEARDHRPPPAPELVRSLLDCLSDRTAADRGEWRAVGTALKHEGERSGDADTYLADWLAFSARGGASYKGAADCEAEWAGMRPDGGITAGSLFHLARRDDPVAYDAELQRHRGDRQALGAPAAGTQPFSPLSADMSGDLKARLLARFPERLGWLPDAPAFRHLPDGEVTLAHGGRELRVDKAYSVFLDSGYLGLLCPDVPIKGPLSALHKSIDPKMDFVYNRNSEDTAELHTEDKRTSVTLFKVRTDGAGLAQIVSRGSKDVTVDNKKRLDAVMTAIRAAQRSHGDRELGTLNAIFNIGTLIVNNNNGSGDATDTAFDLIRVKLLDHASRRRHMKADGFVYEPVPGCPCAYRQLCTYEEYINLTLEGDAVFNSNPKRFREAMEYMKHYRVKQMPEHKPDRELLSFRNGVLSMSDVAFTPNADIVAAHPLHARVARHHIDLEFTGGTDTPLLDAVLDAQFERDVAQLLCALIGRLLFPVGKLDNWQVMPYLVGVGGTGKSLILAVVQHLFAVGAVGNLAAKREDVFGMANLADKDVVIGRDMPRALSGVLSQEVMQCMTAAEHMEIPRKGTTALNIQWTAPVIMASNHLPDYVNTGGNVSRRLVPFNHENPVSAPKETLLEDILATELPNVVARILHAYKDARARAKAAGGFWKSVPEKVREWQGALSSATNKLHHFLSMDDDDRGCVIEKEGGKVTCLIDFKTVYKNRMGGDCIADASVFAAFGFRLSAGLENVCKSCKQLAKARGGKCCDLYSHDSRWKREVIVDMRITPNL